ncbi:MAG: proline--tRNA ligase [Nitrososphaeraceae archaeon]
MSSKEIGITVKKNENFSEWYTQIVTKSGLIDYSPIKGFIVLKPYGYRIWELIKEYLDEKLKSTGHQNGFLPVLIPESLLSKESDHFHGFIPEVFWVTKAGNNDLSDNLAVRPTSETLAYSIFSKWIMSYRDLPLKMNFWNSALRAEIKGTKPFIRNSEFLWQEGHTVHETSSEAKKEVSLILDIYKSLIEEELAISTISGYKSEKEKFVGALYTTTLESLMPDGKALQMATSHNLGQNFSKPFEIRFLNKDSKQHFAWQTSWGISWRLIGALIMIHGDDKGLILPPKISPIQVVIVPIFKNKNKDEVITTAKEIKSKLLDQDLRVYLDERDEYTSGWKFHDWEVKGVPLRINIGKRDIEKKVVELVRRDIRSKEFIKFNDLEKIQLILNDIQSSLYQRSTQYQKSKIFSISNYEKMRSICDNDGGFIRTGWCGDEKCEEKIKNDIGADIRVIPFANQVSEENKCILCNKDASKTVFFAKAY